MRGTAGEKRKVDHKGSSQRDGSGGGSRDRGREYFIDNYDNLTNNRIIF